jgi:hypothetical protein
MAGGRSYPTDQSVHHAAGRWTQLSFHPFIYDVSNLCQACTIAYLVPFTRYIHPLLVVDSNLVHPAPSLLTHGLQCWHTLAPSISNPSVAAI